jgi:hypothetical protein
LINKILLKKCKTHTLTQSVQIEIKGNKYNAVFPNTGQYMEIRNRISILISDLNIRDVYDQYAALLAEMIATYNVLLPELKKDINIDSILKLSMMESKEILDTYTDAFISLSLINGWL